MDFCVVILAAGKGTRMRSTLPKVLAPLAGRPLLEHVLATSNSLGSSANHVVYGYGGEAVREAMAQFDLHWALQEQQLGTGHAVAQALPAIADEQRVLVLYGDVPLITEADLRPLLDVDDPTVVSVLTVELSDPTGYGRIIRAADGNISKIVEEKDANDAEKAVTEVNTGIIAASASALKSWIAALSNENSQGEYYLTDIIEMAAKEGVSIVAVPASCEQNVAGVNDRKQLAQLERHFQRQIADQLMAEGVTLIDPARLDVRGSVCCGKDVLIDINVIFEGDVTLGNGVQIGANCVIRNTRIGDGVIVQPNCVFEQAEIGPGATLGPFTRLRPEARLAEGVHVGNFVEIKKSDVGVGSKVGHLTYLGDSTIGRNVNIGAGTITCNYDGANKHQTIIGDDAFIGSCSQLVAPVTVGAGATIGAGSTITKTAAEGKLTLSRAKQMTLPHWERPKKKTR